MKLFFFDTETTWTDPNHDQILQFWWIFWNYNEVNWNFIEEESINQFINVHVPISESASNVHHIYKKDIEWFGYIDEYISKFLEYFKKSDVVIWHKVNFNKNMVIWECSRLWIEFDFDSIKWLDTMKPTKELVKARRIDWRIKWPKLIELYRYLFHKDFDWAHDALADITATKDCFLELVKNYNIFDIPKPSYWLDKRSQRIKEQRETNKTSLEKINKWEYWELEGLSYKYVWEVKNWHPYWQWEMYYKWVLWYKWTCFSYNDCRFRNFSWEWIKYYLNWELEYEWEFQNWLYDWKWKTYYKWELEYIWTFKSWLYHWKWKLYYIWKLEYEWDFFEWNFCGLWKKYSENWTLLYEGYFILWKYNGNGTLYDDDWDVVYDWFFIKWYPEKIYNKKLIEKYLEYKRDPKKPIIQDIIEDDDYDDEDDDDDAMYEYEDKKSLEEYDEFYEDVDNKNLVNWKYERVKVRKAKDDEDDNDDNDNFYNQTYDEEGDIEYIPNKS